MMKTKSMTKAQRTDWVKHYPERIKLGEEIYQKYLRRKLEKNYNGKVACIDYDTHEYFIGDDVLDAAKKAKAKYPDKLFYIVRVGSKGVYTLNSPR